MMRKCLTMLLVGILLLSVPMVAVHATESTTESDETDSDKKKELTEEEKAQKKIEAAWKKIYKIEPDTNAIENWPQGPKVWASGAILMDMKSGAVLYGKDIKGKYYPASITKLLTALVALQNSELTDIVTGSDSSYDDMDSTYASIALKKGERLTMEDALYALLFSSANEVGHAIGESATEGGYEDFIAKMNEEKDQLGCVNSNFVNTNGIHNENHYTCAYDMALIGSAVYQIDAFRQIESNITHTIPKTNKSKKRKGIDQHHKMMIPENSHYYKYIKAGKTGYTDAAKSTLVSMADNGTLQLVCVDLSNGKALIYDDTEAMCEYGFNNFKKIMLKDATSSENILSFTDADDYVVVPNNVKFSDLTEEITIGQNSSTTHEGTVSYSYNGQPVGSANVVVSQAYYKQATDTPDLTFGKTGETTIGGFHIQRWMVIVAAVVLILFLLLWMRLIIVRKRKRERAIKRQRIMERRTKK